MEAKETQRAQAGFAGDTHCWVVIPNGFGYPKAIPTLLCLAHLPPFGNFFTGRSSHVIGSSHEMQEDVYWGLLEEIFLP